jgi:hypothetical protein
MALVKLMPRLSKRGLFFRLLIAPVFLPFCLFSPLTLGVPVEYVGPNHLTVAYIRSNAGSNLSAMGAEIRPLADDRLVRTMESALEAGLTGCSLEGISRVTVSAALAPDRIGYTGGSLEGLGLYVNFPEPGSLDHVGRFWIAPYFALRVEVTTSSGERRPAGFLIDFTRIIVDQPSVRKVDFLMLPTSAFETPLFSYLEGRMTAALRQALPQRCGQARQAP